MPAEEFDAYLKTLSARLRLKPGRRAELADELRDHLETRLDELTADGLPRAAAVQQALAEFGDAAGLASQMSYAFTVFARRRRRKTLMRVTASAAATLACVVAVAYLFAPPNRAVNPPGPALAQEEAGTAAEPAADPFAGPTVADDAPPRSPDAAKIAALDAALDAPTSLAELRPGDVLLDVLDDLAEQHGIVILPEVAELAAAGLDLRDLPLENPPRFEGYSLRTSLKVLLNQVDETGLAAAPRDGILFITTQERAGLDLETRIYNVRDLLADVRTSPAVGGLGGVPGAFGGGQAGGAGMFSLPPVHNQFGGGTNGGTNGEMGGEMGGGMGGGMGGFAAGRSDTGLPAGAADDLVNMILSVTGGEAFGGPWTLVNGEGGTIEHFNGLLAVRQTAAVHRQIEELLAALRRSAAERGWDAAATPGPDAFDAAASETPETLLVVVGANGMLSIDGQEGLSAARVRTVLNDLATQTPQRPVIVEADENVPYQTVQDVVASLTRAGFTGVALRATAAPGDAAPAGGAPAGGGSTVTPRY